MEPTKSRRRKSKKKANVVENNMTVGEACRLGKDGLTRRLLRAGHEVFPDDRSWWPIHEAANGLHLDCCRVLVESGHCDINARTQDRDTPLMLVCRMSCRHVLAVMVARYLLDNGAKPDIRGANEITPLIQAIKSKNTALALLLINKGANPRALWYNGWSALHEAANAHDLVMMQRLIGLGADIFAIDTEGQTALMVSVQNNFFSGVKLLLKVAQDRAAELADMSMKLYGDDNVDPVRVAAYGWLYGRLGLFRDTDFSIEIPDFSDEMYELTIPYVRPLFSRQCQTPLYEAVCRGHTAIVEKLIEVGAKMTYVKKCFSPFLYAFGHSTENILYKFLENDVDINAMSIGRLCDVPDALISALSTCRRRKLFLLLCCGLDPALKKWCKCNNGYSLMRGVMRTSSVTDVDKLMKLLVLFSPGIPNCCNEVAEVVGVHPKIPKLLHLCRLAVRKCFRTSKLLHGRFLDDLPIPESMRNYMTFQPVPEELLPNAHEESEE